METQEHERLFGGPNGYGHKHDPLGRKHAPIERLFAARRVDTSAALPDHDELSPFVACVLDQGSGEEGTSSCEGHRMVGAIAVVLNRRALRRGLGMVDVDPVNPPAELFNPIDPYTGGRAIERAREYPSGDLPALIDEGAITADVFEAGRRHGFRAARGCSNFPASPASVNKEISLDLLESESTHKMVGGFDAGQGGARIEQARRAITQLGVPVAVDTDVDPAFELWTPDQAPIGAPDPAKSLGGHAIFAADYRFDPRSGTFEWLIVNSWTTGWGLSGCGWCSEAWFRAARAVRVMDLKEAA